MKMFKGLVAILQWCLWKCLFPLRMFFRVVAPDDGVDCPKKGCKYEGCSAPIRMSRVDKGCIIHICESGHRNMITPEGAQILSPCTTTE